MPLRLYSAQLKPRMVLSRSVSASRVTANPASGAGSTWSRRCGLPTPARGSHPRQTGSRATRRRRGRCSPSGCTSPSRRSWTMLTPITASCSRPNRSKRPLSERSPRWERVVVGALVGPAVQAFAGIRIQPGGGIGEEQLGVVVAAAVVVGRLQLPRIAELMGVLDEPDLSGGVPERPVLCGRGVAAPFELAAVAGHEGQRAPHVVIGVGLLPGIAERQRAVLADLSVDHAIEEGAVGLEAAQVRVAVLAHGDHAAGPGAVLQ